MYRKRVKSFTRSFFSWVFVMVLAGCGGERQIAASPRREELPASSSPAPSPPTSEAPADRFACREDADCTNDCELGAVSLVWRSHLAPRAACEDGCESANIGAPRCVDRACVATHRDGSPAPECTALDDAVQVAAPMELELEGLAQGQSTESGPQPDVILRLHNRTSEPQRVHILAAEIWVARESGEVALPVSVEGVDLRAPDEHVGWLEHTTIAPGTTRDATVYLGALDVAPANTFPYRVRLTFGDDQGRISATECRIDRVYRDPIRE